MSASDYVGTVTDLDTGERVHRVAAVNVEAGLLEQWQSDERGHPVVDAVTKRPLRRLFRGRFSADLRPRPARERAPTLGAPTCVRCPSKMTLPGDDLCPVCRAREQGRRISVEPLVNLMEPRACDNGCGREATWSVSDETAVTPVRGDHPVLGQAWFLRGAMVGRRWYCSWCYSPPRILDARGEVMETLEEAGGCRPS